MTIFLVINIQANNRINKFNLELTEIISSGADQTVFKYTVGGTYGSLMTVTEFKDSFSELSNIGKSDTNSNLLLQKMEIDLRKYSCGVYILKRFELLTKYSQYEDYKKDEKFIVAKKDNPTCVFQTPSTTYEYYTDENGKEIFTINGEVDTLGGTTVEELFNYGNPSPALKELMSKNNATLNAKEVQYNMKNNVEKIFGLEGSAKLCDYYNWGYDKKIESTHFCMEVTPHGGGLKDRWYIYCSRNINSQLYHDLMAGEVSVQMIAKIERKYFEENQQNQATLITSIWY